MLQERIGHLLTRPVGRPPNKPQVFFASFSYQAQSWTRPRRVVAKVEWHQGELYPRVGFIVTNLKRPAGAGQQVLQWPRHRRAVDQGRQAALRWTRLSCRAFRHNAVRLQLHALAYNLANFLRSLALPQEVEQWSLTTLREKLVKIGARIVRHGRYVVFQLAEVAVPRVALRRDPAPDRPAARIARAGDMTGGNQMMAAVEGRAMRRSPAEPAATSCRGAWKRLRSLPTVRIVASGALPVDRRVSERHRRFRRRWPSGESRSTCSAGRAHAAGSTGSEANSVIGSPV